MKNLLRPIIYALPLFMLYGCSDFGPSARSVPAVSMSLGFHELEVELAGDHPVADESAANYRVAGDHAFLLLNDELFIDDRSYGELTTPSVIRMTLDGEVTINGAPATGTPAEGELRAVPSGGGVTVNIGDNPLHTGALNTLYRLTEDKQGNPELWSPNLNAQIIDGRLYVNGDDYGPIQPGQRIDLEWPAVLVDYERREKLDSRAEPKADEDAEEADEEEEGRLDFPEEV